MEVAQDEGCAPGICASELRAWAAGWAAQIALRPTPQVFADPLLWQRSTGLRPAYYGMASRMHHAVLVRLDRLPSRTAVMATLVHELVHLRWRSFSERQVSERVEQLTGISVEGQRLSLRPGRFIYRCPRHGCRYRAAFRRRPSRRYRCGFCRAPAPALVPF